MAYLHRLVIALLLLGPLAAVAQVCATTYVSGVVKDCGLIASATCVGQPAGSSTTNTTTVWNGQGNTSQSAVAMAAQPLATTFLSCNNIVGHAYFGNCEVRSPTRHYMVQTHRTQYTQCANDSSYCPTLTGKKSITRAVDVSDYRGKVGTTLPLCVGPLGVYGDGGSHCLATGGDVSMCAGTGPEGTYTGTCWVEGATYTGANCDPAAYSFEGPTPSSPSTASPTSGAPKGYCPGEVNGITMWVPCSTTVEQSTPKASTTTTGDGTTTTTQSVTQNQTTTCERGVCTTVVNSTTVNNGTGTGTVTSTTTSQSQALYCSTNPTAAACGGSGGGGSGDGDGSGFGGSCTDGFACDGDAAMCAIAKAVNETKCKFFDTPSPEQTAYEAAAAASSATGLGSTTTTISSADFDQTNALGGAACIQDRSITIAMSTWSKTLVLPWSIVCPYAAQFGTLLVALSLMSASFIVFRRG